jgi:hypothetical protein
MLSLATLDGRIGQNWGLAVNCIKCWCSIPLPPSLCSTLEHKHLGENPLRPNPLKSRLAAGGCAFGTMTFEFFTPGYPAICREAGAEFILYDMEHSGVGFETLKAQFAFCRGLDLVPLMRVPSDDYHHIARALGIWCDGHHGAYGRNGRAGEGVR